jgi:hypothetical protein
MVLSNTVAVPEQFAQFVLRPIQPLLGSKPKVHERLSDILLQSTPSTKMQGAEHILAVLAASSGALACKSQPSHQSCTTSEITTTVIVNRQKGIYAAAVRASKRTTPLRQLGRTIRNAV